jgi:prevent-host-death family protein
MEPLEIFTVRDLRQRSGELLREAEEGRLALITKHGRPAILALPFDERLLAHGVHRALALHLFEANQVSLAQAAKIATLSLEDFIELLGRAGIPAVDYDPAELAQELEVPATRS